MQINTIRLKFDKLKAETPKAYLLQIGNEEHWLPKKLCWRLITNKKLGGNCVLPAWFYEKVTGIQLSDLDEADQIQLAETIIEHHKPAIITPKENNIINDLTKQSSPSHPAPNAI
jgi:hypothetical protein